MATTNPTPPPQRPKLSRATKLGSESAVESPHIQIYNAVRELQNLTFRLRNLQADLGIFHDTSTQISPTKDAAEVEPIPFFITVLKRTPADLGDIYNELNDEIDFLRDALLPNG